MKVIYFINELDKIGYNDETELTFWDFAILIKK